MLEFLIGTLAAVGLVCIFRALYDILFVRWGRECGSVTLTVRADSDDGRTEQLLRTATEVRSLFFPHMRICFLDEGEDAGDPHIRALADCQGIEYRVARKRGVEPDES